MAASKPTFQCFFKELPGSISSGHLLYSNLEPDDLRFNEATLNEGWKGTPRLESESLLVYH